MGKPGTSYVVSPTPEHIGCMEGTPGSETSQYRQEEKTTCDSVSSGERKRMRLNRSRVIAGRRCVVGVVGPPSLYCHWDRESKIRVIVEGS